ncbi:MAG TPA: DEAD/DEAH box helicase, partial [Candidatus Binatia bacterium]|nr:DEAD/DEAH box helicase [Candidatus Binatia bacterium]
MDGGGVVGSFSPLVARWFTARFGTPTPAQEAGWPAIAAGSDTLIAAPTGSGKTLAAFLWSVDVLLRRAAAGTLEDRTHVVYVSPLKALGNDVQKNLQQPLGELAALAGVELPVRVMVRTGDTPASERQAMTRRPPHILITTPESLYILLTAEKSRRFLANAETVIVDEIHAVAQDKRGSHLALTLERLDANAGAPLQRIGLSATQRPIEDVGRLLVGATRKAPVVVDVGHRRQLDLSVWVPELPLGPIATHEQWAEVYDRLVALTMEHRSTIVFVNTRRLVERVAHALEERVGKGRVAAHHGSMARRTRLEAEEKLKGGEVPVVVATASLELGIDVGAVDLVCHLGAPRALATLIQRVGRSGHARGAIPKGIIFPLTRDELVQAAAAVRAVRDGELDRLVIPTGPRDILAQQCVAIVAAGELGVEELFALVRRAWPYRDLARDTFDEVLEMVAEGVATRRGRRSAHVHWDRVNHRLRPRRGARLDAITGGGAIPDVADFDVVEEPQGTLVGKVNEDFAVESMRGDIFLLGNRSWRIRRVEAGRMRVEDAQGAPPTIPFWLGEAQSRTRELSDAVGTLREQAVARRHEPSTWIEETCGVGASGAEQIVAYLGDGHAALGATPTTQTIIAERFFDEAGGMQLILHAPFGGRINRALGLALRKRFCVTFNFELQAAATDDGIVLSLGAQHSFPLDSVFGMIRRETLADDLAQAALAAPMFTNRWRWNATRSLALRRHESGKRVPMPLQRMRAEDLLAAVFPEQLGCAENMGGGPIPIPDHPLVDETVDNCLREAMDVDGADAVLAAIASGAIRTVAIDTVAPSPLSHELLNSNPYTYLDDAPLEERRARAVSLRQSMPELAGGLGALDGAAIAEVARQAWPVARDVDELHDVLLTLGVLPRAELDRAGWTSLADALVHAGRATWAGTRLVAAERMSLVRLALPDVTFAPAVQAPLFGRRGEIATEEDALRAIVGGWLEHAGVVTVPELAARMEVAASRVAIGLAQLERSGSAMRGRYRAGADEEWCDRALLARIHRMTVGRLRREIEPVTAADLMRFLFRWQHVQPGTRVHGRHGLLEVVSQLEGLELPARAWEAQVLPARVSRYLPDDLEHLCLAGELAWGRLRVDAPDDDAGPRPLRSPGRAAPLAFVLREDLPWLLGPPVTPADLPSSAQAVHDALASGGASFTVDLARNTGLMPATVEDALWTLVARGLVTGDGIAGLRMLIDPPDDGRRLRMLRGGRGRLVAAGRWALLRHGVADEPGADAMQFARLLLRRWGVVLRELVARETVMPPWRLLLAALRTLEARGEVRGGRFVAGMVGEQFALPEAVEALRAVRRRDGIPETVVVAAADPLNLVGIVVPGARVSPLAHEVIAWRDGAPIEVGELGAVRSR